MSRTVIAVLSSLVLFAVVLARPTDAQAQHCVGCVWDFCVDGDPNSCGCGAFCDVHRGASKWCSIEDTDDPDVCLCHEGGGGCGVDWAVSPDGGLDGSLAQVVDAKVLRTLFDVEESEEGIVARRSCDGSVVYRTYGVLAERTIKRRLREIVL